MIVGTAGHIDHGKTSLVRALTGIDTDRLKEEKARGITIELGFAYIPAGGDRVLGFVDVPGHERLVHTMIAGAASIDMALLVVAADDVVVSPAGHTARVRSLHAMNRTAERGVEGDRCALNLRGPDIHHSNISRGDWIVAPQNASISGRCDVELTLLDSERRSLRHWT